ncbi:MAG: response regulator [Bacteroidetes bacterium]|nr:response regulator [Bacteroidota bacterium]
MNKDKQTAQLKGKLIDNVPLAFARFHLEYNSQNHPISLQVIDVNDEFEKLTGKSRQFLVGRDLIDTFPELKEIIDEQLKIRRQNFLNTESYQFEFRYEASERWYDIHVKVLDFENITLLLSDCTNRKTFESQINNLNNIFYDLGIDPAENINVIVKKTHDIIKCACSLYNRIDDEDRSLITWSDYNAPENLDRKDKPDGHICYEATIKGIDKPVIIEDINATEFYLSDPNVKKYGLRSYLGMPVIVYGKTIGSLCVVDTVPKKYSNSEINIIRTLAKVLSLEQKRLFVEENLKKAVEESRKANEAKTRFLANMSHEIRTPLNGVIGFSEMLSSQEKDEGKARILRMIEESGNQLVQIVNDIFDYSRIETGKIELQPEEFNFTETLKSTLGFFYDAAAKKNVNLVFNGDEIAHDELFGDAMKLKQIFINVINNAVKFTSEGTVMVIAKSKIYSGNIITDIIIEDTGIGISTEQQEGIFDEFKQHDRYLAKKIKGTGLGLAITKKLTPMMKGTITVESEQGKGSRFSISIPFELRIKNNDKFGEIMSEPEENKNLELGKVNILLAEDNEANQFLIKAITKSQDWDIVTVDNGEAAVDMFKSRQFDLVLMDVQMPIMNGYDATKIIREYEITFGRRTPIIALTAYAMKTDKDLCIEAGMDDYISKPFKRQQFLETINKVLNQSGPDI